MKFDEAIELLERHFEHRAVDLLKQLRESKRSMARRRAAPRSRRLTPVDEREVYKLYCDGDLTVPQIASRFNVNPGRVVEVADRLSSR